MLKVPALALLMIASCASARAEVCSRVPAPGGDPGVAVATALQIERCRGSTATVMHVSGTTFDTEFASWTFDLDRVRIEIVPAASSSGEKAPSFRQRTGAAFAINGGFFDFGANNEMRPVGLFIDKGLVKNPLGRGLSGTLLVAGHRLEIVTTDSVGRLAGYKFGLQSRPLLVDPGNRLGMRGNDGERVPRSAVCLTDKRHVTFFYAGRNGLSLFELATLLQAPTSAGGFGCDVALNLDGGPSTQVAADADGAPFERLGQNVVNAIVVLPGR